MTTRRLPDVPFLRALHSYLIDSASGQAEDVQTSILIKVATYPVMMANLDAGTLDLIVDTDAERNVTVYVTIRDDAGSEHVLTGIPSRRIGLRNAESVARALTAAGLSLDPPATAPDDASELFREGGA